jgi:hypothetical protein
MKPCRHVRTALHLGLERVHDLAHVLDAGGAGRRDGCCDQLLELRLAQRCRQIGPEHREFRGFLGDQVGAPAGLKMADGFAPLLDHLLKYREHLAIVELNALVDLTLLDGGKDQADARQPLLVGGPHRRLHVFLDAGLQVHWRRLQRAARTKSRETRLRCRLTAAAFLRLRS